MNRLFASGGQRLSFSLSISPSKEYSGFISVRIDLFDFLAVQGILTSLLQHHSAKASPAFEDAATVQETQTRSRRRHRRQRDGQGDPGFPFHFTSIIWVRSLGHQNSPNANTSVTKLTHGVFPEQTLPIMSSGPASCL